MDGRSVELGPLGEGRPTRHPEPDDAGRGERGAETGEGRGVCVAGPYHRQGAGARQPASDWTGDDARRRRTRHGPVHHLVPRLGHHPHRRALPLLVPGKDLQRLRPLEHQGRRRLPTERHRKPEERHHDARHPRRHAAAEEGALPRTRHTRHGRRPRSVGEVRRREDPQRRRAVPAHRAMGATRREGRLECRGERRRLPRVGAAVAEAARCGAARQ